MNATMTGGVIGRESANWVPPASTRRLPTLSTTPPAFVSVNYPFISTNFWKANFRTEKRNDER